REGVLLVPNAALRFTPPKPSAAAPSGGFIDSLMTRPPSQPKQAKVVNKDSGGKRTVWVLQGKQPAALVIEVGLTNGRLTEVVSGDLKPGTAVITGTQKTAK
ncbi:MAG: efflux RND transporter periplasmic adaptor subunit, partial [Sideroxydans sp.]